MADSVNPTEPNDEPTKAQPSGEADGNPAVRRALSRAEILAGLTDILARIAGADPESITLDALIIDDVGVDSLGFYEILIEADETMGIKIEEKDLLTFKTVRDIVTYIEQRENARLDDLQL
ncbi:putative acyl carrier protein [Cyanobium sp. PCC 7001]|uniref:acyl carrier protein n=1 Tax=Cyanobium sp. PCC 7001 TaxID=180281 RepID=UPI0001805AED|nr:acyl carrier protein [Cyanobium sp. PCC 7001]EDY37142.1 putative acyl carrier protein [Cyanobium sp. PCC 7001]